MKNKSSRYMKPRTTFGTDLYGALHQGVHRMYDPPHAPGEMARNAVAYGTHRMYQGSEGEGPRYAVTMGKKMPMGPDTGAMKRRARRKMSGY